MLSWDDEDDCYPESLESLKQASASFVLHESASCAALLPCGLLPEELEELESLTLEADLIKSAAAPAAAALKTLAIASGGSSDAPAPLTPQGVTTCAGTARLLSDAEDDEMMEDGGEACGDAACLPTVGDAACLPTVGDAACLPAAGSAPVPATEPAAPAAVAPSAA